VQWGTPHVDGQECDRNPVLQIQQLVPVRLRAVGVRHPCIRPPPAIHNCWTTIQRMAGSPHRIRTDLYVLDRPSIPSGPKPGPPGFLAGSLNGRCRLRALANQSKGGRAPVGRWSAGESVLPNSSSGESYCAGHAGGSKMYRNCERTCRIVRENEVRDRCMHSLWRSWFDEYA